MTFNNEKGTRDGDFLTDDEVSLLFIVKAFNSTSVKTLLISCSKYCLFLIMLIRLLTTICNRFTNLLSHSAPCLLSRGEEGCLLGRSVQGYNIKLWHFHNLQYRIHSKHIVKSYFKQMSLVHFVALTWELSSAGIFSEFHLLWQRQI